MLRRRSLIFACLISVLLSACAASGGLFARDQDDAYINVSLGPVNHTDQFLYGFTVNGAFGANARAYGWDYASTCCVRLPRVYRPGLTVDVKYNLLIMAGRMTTGKSRKASRSSPIPSQATCMCTSSRTT